MSGDNKLIEIARAAREHAHAPYSNFRVGAAVRTKSGKIYSGCNIENATYGLTLCAERVAVFKAISEGEREFEAIAVVCDTERPTPPCGPCELFFLCWHRLVAVPSALALLRCKMYLFSGRQPCFSI